MSSLVYNLLKSDARIIQVPLTHVEQNTTLASNQPYQVRSFRIIDLN